MQPNSSDLGGKDTPKRTNESTEVVFLSPEDEVANVITHSIGLVLSLAAILFFFWRTGDSRLGDEWAGMRATCLLFTISMSVVYLFSTLSHAVQRPLTRQQLRAWDQGTIYCLIAGTYSPFVWAATDGWWRVGLMLAIWAAAALGFYSKVWAAHRVNSVATLTYLALGWLPAIPLVGKTPWICFVWMLGGGLAYSIGVLFLKQSHRIRYSHAAWHVMVMLGSACHCYAIYRLLQSLSTR